MTIKRAFEGYINMAVVDAKGIDGRNAPIVYRNIEAHLKSAFGMVGVSDEAIELLGQIDEAFRTLAVELDALPFGLGRSSSADGAKLHLVSSIEALRMELRLCPPSDAARALGLQ